MRYICKVVLIGLMGNIGIIWLVLYLVFPLGYFLCIN
ncbi:hypothetical protein [Bacteriophage sp.]|nr:hypothetical protein [Bacteriophage sp.]